MAMMSMTGYGISSEGGVFVMEMKSVNHKYLDIRLRLPSELSPLEPRILEFLKKRMRRGSVDVTISRSPQAPVLRKPRLNREIAGCYLEILRELSEKLPKKGNFDAASMLSLKDIVEFESSEKDLESAFVSISVLAGQVLERYDDMRRTEGAAISVSLTDCLKKLESCVEKIAAESDKIVPQYREKLKGRINSLRIESQMDEGRLEQEIAIMADRCDITEELERLGSHISQFKNLLSGDESCGKKMDFVIQEMNRESNTIGSKAQFYPISSLVIEMKSQIEKMREQTVNLE